MNKKSRGFIALDILLIIGMILPILCAILLKILFIPQTEGITITGAYIFFTIPLPLGGLPITESQVNSWLVIISILFVCLYLTHGIKEKPDTKRQYLAEWIVEKVEGLVHTNMGDYFAGYVPFICAVLGLSAFSSLMSLFGLYPPTSDINVVGGWAILVFILITYYKMKCGPGHYLKSFVEPVPVMLPMNIISEVATPVSMAFRHFGNVLSGTVISVLIGTALNGASSLVLGWLPGVLGEFPLLRIGIPAILSIYFDVFSGCVQAFIFSMLTMLYISGAFPEEDYFAKKERKKQEKLAKSNG